MHFLIPLTYSQLKTDALLFIGSNPSFVPKAYQKVLNKYDQYGGIGSEAFLNWNNHNKYKLETYKHIEEEVRSTYRPYFGVFEDISKRVNMDWGHIDLFFYRQTNQSEFKPKVYDMKMKKLNDFGRDQVNFSKQLINAIHPRVIVVVNKFASDIFSGEYNLKWKEEYGYHITQFSDREVPVFLGSMLSGRRALDVYSRERLIWHVKKSLQGPG